MKQTLLFFGMLLTVATAFSQSAKYADAMKANLSLSNSAKEPADFQAAAAAFERIGNAEKNQWLPFYYAALTQLRMGMMDKEADKDGIAKKVYELIDKAEAINKNSELATLRYMNATLQLIVNPMERWQKFGAEAEAAYQSGIALDANNPRLYYLKALSLLNTPPQFGGGMEAAKPLLEKAVAARDKSKTTDELLPKWGVEESKKVLEGK